MNRLKSLKLNLKYCIKSKKWMRDEKIVLFGAWFGEKFSDNSRYLYQYLCLNKNKLGLKHVVWVTNNEKLNKQLNKYGYESYMMHSEQSIFYHMHAKYHIICNNPVDTEILPGDILGYYSFGAIKINLWHGIGFKGVNFSNKKMQNKIKKGNVKYIIYETLFKHSKIFRTYFTGQGGWKNCYYLSVSEFATDIFQKYFFLPKNQFIVSGYPRNCKGLPMLECENKVIAQVKDANYTILYLPTFREYPLTEDLRNICNKISDVLSELNILWIEKPHSASKYTEEKQRTENDNQIINLESEFDINLLIPYVDMVITDYSSVFYDAYYHLKPVIFYIPDFEKYNETNGFVVEPEKVMCGIKCKTITELKKAIKLGYNNPPMLIPENYKIIRREVWGKEKGLPEIWDDILNKTKK